MELSYIDIVRLFITAYNTSNVPGMMALLHPEIHFTNISNGITNVKTTGKSEFEKLAERSAVLFKEREQRIISWSVSENIVQLEIQYHAVLAMNLSNGLKIGERLDLRGKSEYIFKEGLIYSIVDES